jgi:hypothetical protein
MGRCWAAKHPSHPAPGRRLPSRSAQNDKPQSAAPAPPATSLGNPDAVIGWVRPNGERKRSRAGVCFGCFACRHAILAWLGRVPFRYAECARVASLGWGHDAKEGWVRKRNGLDVLEKKRCKKEIVKGMDDGWMPALASIV